MTVAATGVGRTDGTELDTATDSACVLELMLDEGEAGVGNMGVGLCGVELDTAMKGIELVLGRTVVLVASCRARVPLDGVTLGAAIA